MWARIEWRAMSSDGSHCPAESSTAMATASSPQPAAAAARRGAWRHAGRCRMARSAPATAAIAPNSADPHRIVRAVSAPHTTAARAVGRPSARSPARTIQGSQAAPAMCAQRLTSDRNGPDSTHTRPAKRAAARESPRWRESAYVPTPASTKWATVKQV
jgi:hypothetical protein